MNTIIKLQILKTRDPISHKNKKLPFVTYTPRTNVTNAKSYTPEGFRKV